MSSLDRNGASLDDWFRSSNYRPQRSNDVDRARHSSGVRHGCALNSSTLPQLQFWNWRRCARMNQVVPFGALTVWSDTASSNRQYVIAEFLKDRFVDLSISPLIHCHWRKLPMDTELYSNNMSMTRNYTLLCHQWTLSYNLKTVSLLYTNGLPKMYSR